MTELILNTKNCYRVPCFCDHMSFNAVKGWGSISNSDMAILPWNHFQNVWTFIYRPSELFSRLKMAGTIVFAQLQSV